ncbi:MAG: HAMP domain-containing protein [Gammaproteobacteria bacterium]|nr:HAMP domain-containing protein [Gammaproteobacteria bacterium]
MSVILCVSFLTGQIDSRFFISAYNKTLINLYAETSLSLYDKHNLKPIKKWLKHIEKNQKITLYLLNTDGTIISSTPIPKHINVITQRLKTHDFPNQTYKDNFILMSAPMTLQNQHTYRLAMYLSEAPPNRIFNPIKNILLRLCIASILAFILSYAVSRLFMKRLNQIGKSVTRISQGELDTRTPSSLTKGHDEVSTLAGQVNVMADKIQTLITSKERLLEDISHELRSPLARQQTALEIARRKTSTIDKHHLDRIEQENIHMDCLVNEILELATLNRTERPLHPETFSLSALIKKIIKNAHYETQTHCISFNSCNNTELFADAHLIYRAIENIIRNALHHTGKNKQIEITLNQTQRDLVLTISDNGPGINENDLEYIFSPFYKSQTLGHQSKQSYGLGLAITKQIIDLYQGTISAKNRPSGGLEVSIHLPHK